MMIDYKNYKHQVDFVVWPIAIDYSMLNKNT